MKDLLKRLGPVAGYLATLLVGAAFGRVVIPASVDEARMQAIAQHVVMLPAPVQAAALAADNWRAHAASFFAELRALPGVRLPGDRRKAERARVSREGVRLPASLWRQVVAAAGGSAANP